MHVECTLRRHLKETVLWGLSGRVPSRGLKRENKNIQAKKVYSFLFLVFEEPTPESQLNPLKTYKWSYLFASERWSQMKVWMPRRGGGTPNRISRDGNERMRVVPTKPKNPSTKIETPKIPCRILEPISPKHFKLSVLYDLTNSSNRWLGSPGG